MRNTLPFAWMPRAAQKRLFLVMIVLALAAFAGISAADRGLRTAASPAGIVSFEFAGSVERAGCMLAAWGAKGTVLAGISLGLDYLFLLTYSTAISLAAVLMATGTGIRPGALMVRIGTAVPWIAFVAAVLDATENLGLILTLMGTQRTLWPQLAKICAIPKFTIVLLALLFLMVSGITGLLRRKAREHDGGGA